MFWILVDLGRVALAGRAEALVVRPRAIPPSRSPPQALALSGHMEGRDARRAVVLVCVDRLGLSLSRGYTSSPLAFTPRSALPSIALETACAARGQQSFQRVRQTQRASISMLEREDPQRARVGFSLGELLRTRRERRSCPRRGGARRSSCSCPRRRTSSSTSHPRRQSGCPSRSTRRRRRTG